MKKIILFTLCSLIGVNANAGEKIEFQVPIVLCNHKNPNLFLWTLQTIKTIESDGFETAAAATKKVSNQSCFALKAGPYASWEIIKTQKALFRNETPYNYIQLKAIQIGGEDASKSNETVWAITIPKVADTYKTIN